MSNKSVDVYATALKRQEAQKATRQSTQEVTPPRTLPRQHSRKTTRNQSREISHQLPTRDEIQEFSFLLRDELKVKVQAEVPYQWQQELEDVARTLNVKKLELYRFIIGEFLGKVKRKNTP